MNKKLKQLIRETIAEIKKEVKCECCCAEQKDYVIINGLKWDRENTRFAGNKRFTFDNAQVVAKGLGKRLPREQEFEDLVSLGSTWDNSKKGRWCGHDHELKSLSKKSIFFPVATLRSVDGKDILGGNDCYWSSSANGNTNGWFLCIGRNYDNTFAASRNNCHSMRCVSDI